MQWSYLKTFLVLTLIDTFMWIVHILQDISYCLIYKYYRISRIALYIKMSFIEKLISTARHFLATFWWLKNFMSWMSLNYATYFGHVQKIKHCFCLRPFSVFIHGKFSSIRYIFSFFLVSKLYCLLCKLNISFQTITHLVVAYFESWISTLGRFTDVFLDI